MDRFIGLRDFQLNIAERWLERGDQVEDVFSKFFFFFAGFNALYFLWKEVDRVEGGEARQIKHLISKFGEGQPERICGAVGEDIAFFSRRHPIQRMNRRTDVASVGEDREGSRHRRTLQDEHASVSKRFRRWGKSYIS